MITETQKLRLNQLHEPFLMATWLEMEDCFDRIQRYLEEQGISYQDYIAAIYPDVQISVEQTLLEK